MIRRDSLLVTWVQCVDRVPLPSSLPPRGKGRPPGSSARLGVKAVGIMRGRHLHRVQAWLSVLDAPTAELRLGRARLTDAGRFPTRRPWERRLHALPHPLPVPSGGVGGGWGTRIYPWATSGRAVAMDRPGLRANGGVGPKQQRAQGVVPPPASVPEAHWPQSGGHGWGSGWKRPLVPVVAAGWMPMAAARTAATHADPALARRRWPARPQATLCSPIPWT